MIIIGIPIRENGNCNLRLLSFLNAQDEKKTKVMWCPTKYPELGRNSIIEDALKTDFTHIFFLDPGSMPRDIDIIDKLLAHDKDVAAAITPIIIKGKILWNYDKKRGYIGATGMLIKRKVLEKIGYPWYKTLFTYGKNKLKEGEDFFFCRRAQEEGFEVFIDENLKCNHYTEVNLLRFIKSN